MPGSRGAFDAPVALRGPPDRSRIAGLYTAPDLADAYRVRLPDDATDDPEALARHVFLHQAPWVGALMRLRDGLVAPFGLKTSKQLRRADKQRVGIFRIYESAAEEIVLGEDDRHLDFRLSVLRTMRVTDGDEHPYLTVSTVVRCHNVLGRGYLAVIAPFHRAIVQSVLRRAAGAGWPKH